MFTGLSTKQWGDQVVARVRKGVESLPDAAFVNNLDEHLRRIRATLLSEELPVLNFENRSGKRRQINSGSKTGQEYIGDVVDVIIPFSGSKTPFILTPSTAIDVPGMVSSGDVRENAIVLTFDDDEHLERRLEKAYQAVKANLAAGLHDLEEVGKRAEQMITDIVGDRHAAIERLKTIDSGLSTKIT